jgi:hypothetical protein
MTVRSSGLWDAMLAPALASLALPPVKRLARHYRIGGAPLVGSGHSERTPPLGGIAILGRRWQPHALCRSGCCSASSDLH